MRLVYLFLYLSAVNCDRKSLNILTIFPFHGKSHSIVLNTLIEALVQKGHNVTDISFFKINKDLKNYHHINLAGTMKILEDDFLLQRNYITILQIMNFVVSSGNDNCKILLENKEVHNLLKKKEKFDLVVVEQFNTDCPLALAYKLGAPVVSMSTTIIMPWHYHKLGAPYNPSFVPLIFLDGDTNPSLYQRIERTVLYAICRVWYKLGQRTDEQTLSKYFDDIPPLQELEKDIKIFLTYSSLMLFGTNVIPTNVKEVGGFHVAKPERLPDKLLQFIEQSEHGVIYVSFGSIIKSSVSDSDKIAKIVGALSKLPQRIIWKWEDSEPPGNLDKIYISKWLPQKDILAHPKVLAFLSHCGLVSTTEAVTFGVPIVGMPVFGDQPSNAAAIEEKGFGVRIKLSELTEEHLLEKFLTVLDPKAKVKSLSKSWQDRPMPPMETAVFWTEFAARHPNHTFRAPAADVPLYQYLNLDIMLVFALFTISVFLILKFFISFVFASVGTKSTKDKEQ